MEPIEVSNAKDIALAVLEAHADGYYDNDYEELAIGQRSFIDVADGIIEELLKLGVTLPEDLPNPFR